MSSQFLSFFEGELASLYERASAMAARYPERGLALGQGRLADADISMRLLLEGTAYLGARVQQRVERTDYRLAMRMVAVLFPRLLDAVPPKLLARLESRQPTVLDGHESSEFDCAALPAGENRGRYALKPEWQIAVQPIRSTALDVRWLGASVGVKAEISVVLEGEKQARELRELIIAAVELPGERISDLSRRFAGALLCAGRMVLALGNSEVAVRCEPAAWRRAGSASELKSDLRLFLESLAWPDCGCAIRLVLAEPLHVEGGEKILLHVTFETQGETFAADLRRASIIANVAGFANRLIMQSDRFEVDSRRMNNFFAPRASGSEPLVLRAIGARAFEPRTNKARSNDEITFVSSCGHHRIDRKDRWVLVHEPSWAQGDGAIAEGKFSENVFLLPPARQSEPAPVRLDVAIELEVCTPAIRTAVRQGCHVQAISGTQVAEGLVVGNVEAEVAHPLVREELGSVLQLGMGSFATLVEERGADLKGFCDELFAMLAQSSSVVRTSWTRGTTSVSAYPCVFPESVDGIAVVVRGWILKIQQMDSFLRSGAGPLFAAELYRFLRSRCPVNSRLALELQDQEGGTWMRMNS